MPEGKNFGFIECAQGRDYFFHREDFNGFWNDLLTDFRKGKAVLVEFTSEETAKGLRAKEVRRTDGL